MSQHFLLSSKARSLSLAKIMRLSDEEAHATFKAIRWAGNGGEPFCPHCGCVAVYEYKARRIFRCQGCMKPVFGNERDDLCQSQAGYPRLSRGHCDLREWREGL